MIIDAFCYSERTELSSVEMAGNEPACKNEIVEPSTSVGQLSWP